MADAKCHLCGAPCVEVDHSRLCGDCLPIREHTVSMCGRPDIGKRAACPCGWSASAPWTHEGRAAVEAAVREHWRQEIQAARAA